MDESESGQKMRIGLYFATWWSLNVVFNIYDRVFLTCALGHKLSTPKERRDSRKRMSGPTEKYTFQIKDVGPDVLFHGSHHPFDVLNLCHRRTS